MSLSRTRRREGADYWPGFVDALSTLVIAIVFMLSVFVLAQFFIGQEITGKDTALRRLENQVIELTDLLSLERSQKRSAEENLALLQSTLNQADGERRRLQGLADSGAGAAGAAQSRAQQLQGALDAERQLSQRAQSAVELLNQQISAMRRQLAALEDALSASEARDTESQTRIADLGSRLNIALAQRVQEQLMKRDDDYAHEDDLAAIAERLEKQRKFNQQLAAARQVQRPSDLPPEARALFASGSTPAGSV